MDKQSTIAILESLLDLNPHDLHLVIGNKIEELKGIVRCKQCDTIIDTKAFIIECKNCCTESLE